MKIMKKIISLASLFLFGAFFICLPAVPPRVGKLTIHVQNILWSDVCKIVATSLGWVEGQTQMRPDIFLMGHGTATQNTLETLFGENSLLLRWFFNALENNNEQVPQGQEAHYSHLVRLSGTEANLCTQEEIAAMTGSLNCLIGDQFKKILKDLFTSEQLKSIARNLGVGTVGIAKNDIISVMLRKLMQQRNGKYLVGKIFVEACADIVNQRMNQRTPLLPLSSGSHQQVVCTTRTTRVKDVLRRLAINGFLVASVYQNSQQLLTETGSYEALAASLFALFVGVNIVLK